MNVSTAHKAQVTALAFMARVTTHMDPTIVLATQAMRVSVARSTMMTVSLTSAKMAASVVMVLEDIHVFVRVVSQEKRVATTLMSAHLIHVGMVRSVTSM